MITILMENVLILPQENHIFSIKEQVIKTAVFYLHTEDL